MTTPSRLFSPFAMRGLTLANRIVISQERIHQHFALPSAK